MLLFLYPLTPRSPNYSWPIHFCHAHPCGVLPSGNYQKWNDAGWLLRGPSPYWSPPFIIGLLETRSLVDKREWRPLITKCLHTFLETIKTAFFLLLLLGLQRESGNLLPSERSPWMWVWLFQHKIPDNVAGGTNGPDFPDPVGMRSLGCCWRKNVQKPPQEKRCGGRLYLYEVTVFGLPCPIPRCSS